MAHLLKEIPRESLQNLLSSVNNSDRRIHGDSGSTSSIGLESAQLMLFSLHRGDVVEIQGPASSGKTHLLYHFVLLCITPSTQMSLDFGGNGMAAVIYDTDASFDVKRLHQLLLTRLSILLPDDLDMARRVAEESLQRLHVFQPTSLLQLATSLLHLPSYHTSHIPEHEIGLIAVDSISPFYWSDRFIAEQMRNIPQLAQRTPDPASVHPLQHVLTALGQLRLSHSPFIILTNWGLNLASQSNGPLKFYKQHLHPFPPYNTIVSSSSMTGDLPPTPMPLTLTHHITLSSVSIPPFPPELSLHDAAQHEVEYRRGMMQKEEIICLVKTTGKRQMSRLTFCITPENVHVGQHIQTHTNTNI